VGPGPRQAPGAGVRPRPGSGRDQGHARTRATPGPGSVRGGCQEVQFGLGELEVYRGQQGRELGGGAGGGDRGRDRGLGGEPGQGHRGDRGVVGLGDLVQGGEDLLAALRLQVLGRAPGRGLSTVVPGRYLPVRKPAASAKYGTRPGRPGGDVPQLALVGVARDQVVVGLEGDIARQALAVGEVQGGLEALGEMLEAAMCRTLPAFTSSSSAPMISSTGTSTLSKWV
jgi:hypothetical protein